MTTPATLTQRQFADHIGCRPSYVTKLKQEGRLVLTDDAKRVRVAESIARIEATRDPAKRAVAERHADERGAALAVGEGAAASVAEDPAILANPDYQAARAKREHFAAEREEMRYRQEAGELMVAAEVEGAVASILTELRTRLEALPDVLGPQLAPVTDETQIRARLADEIEIALGEVARRFGEITT
ncbi:MAG: hypothetical protein JNM26_07645 [Ideonella sp.]|nr:hypothetical protein [Ideonella sp.]